MDADRALGAKLLAAEAAYAELGVNMCFAAADLSGSGGRPRGTFRSLRIFLRSIFGPVPKLRLINAFISGKPRWNVMSCEIGSFSKSGRAKLAGRRISGAFG